MAYENLIKPEYRGLVFEMFRKGETKLDWDFVGYAMVDPELEGFVDENLEPVEISKKLQLQPVPESELPSEFASVLADYEIMYPFGTGTFQIPELRIKVRYDKDGYYNWSKYDASEAEKVHPRVYPHRFGHPARRTSSGAKYWRIWGEKVPKQIKETKIMDNDLSPIEIDLTNGDKLDESFLTMFGTAVKMLLQRMFGASGPPVKIKGKKSDVEAFTKALTREKSYMETFQQSGLDSPKTYRSKAKLDQAVGKFERTTGLKWPFK